MVGKNNNNNIIIEEDEKTSPYIRYHPGHPTIADGRNNPNIRLSKHLPFITEIPHKTGQLKLLCWHVSEVDNDLELPNQEYEKISDVMSARHDRIAKAIALIVQHQNPDGIFLQGISSNGIAKEGDCLYKKIASLINKININSQKEKNAEIAENEYDSVIEEVTFFDENGEDKPQNRVVNYRGHIVFYNKKIVAKTIYQQGARDQYNILDSGEYIFTLTNNNKISFRNPIIASYDPIPFRHQLSLSEYLLNGADPNIVRATVGVLNCSLSITPYSKPKFIATTVVSEAPLDINNLKQQAYYSSGAYYFNNNTQKLCQASITLVDPTTGAPFEEHQLEPLVEAAEKGQREAFITLRPSLSLDDNYNQLKLIESHTLSTFDAYLKETMGEHIHFWFASNLIGEQGFCCIGFTKLQQAAFLSFLPEGQFDIYKNYEKDGYYCITMPIIKSLKFAKALMSFNLIMALVDLDESLLTLAKEFLDAIPQQIDEVNKQLQTIKTEIEGGNTLNFMSYFVLGQKVEVEKDRQINLLGAIAESHFMTPLIEQFKFIDYIKKSTWELINDDKINLNETLEGIKNIQQIEIKDRKKILLGLVNISEVRKLLQADRVKFPNQALPKHQEILNLITEQYVDLQSIEGQNNFKEKVNKIISKTDPKRAEAIKETYQTIALKLKKIGDEKKLIINSSPHHHFKPVKKKKWGFNKNPHNNNFSNSNVTISNTPETHFDGSARQVEQTNKLS